MKYILYARKSTDTEDKQVLSLDSQVNELQRLADAQGIEIVKIMTESMSAKAPGRPVFNDMLSKITSGEADAILCWKIDRLTRNPIDGGQIQWLLQQGKIQSITTFEKTYSPYDNVLLMSIEQAMATQYIRDLSINVKRGNREKLKRGDWINFAPFGYENDKATRTVAIDSVRAPYLIKMFEMYATGLHSFKQIADTCYNQGLRTKKGNKVYGGNIQRFLNNPFYYGVMRSNGKLYPGNHEPLISKGLFDECQKVADSKIRPRAKTKGFTLSGFIACEKCGCAITAEMKKGKYIYYHCTNGKGNCDQRSFNANEKTLHDQIATDMEKLQISQKLIDIVYKAALEELEHSGEFHNHALDTALKALESLSMRKSRLVDTYTNGDIDEALYREKLQSIEEETTILKQQAKELEKNSQDPRTTIELTYKKFKQGYTMANRYLDASPEEKRIILSEALSNSTLLDRNMASIQYKSPYDIFARTPVNADIRQLRRVRDSNP